MKQRNTAGQLLWEDGTVISMDNYFAICHEPKWGLPTPKEMTKKEIAAEKNRVDTKARWHKKQAMKNNIGNPFCHPITTPEQARKTQAIAGNSTKEKSHEL